MTKEQLLYQIANVGYLTSYGRDKSYSTVDITSKTSSRLAFIGALISILAVVYPIISKTQFIVFTLIAFSVLGIYISKYTDHDKYITSAKELENIERELQLLYYEVKNQSDDANLEIFIEKLKSLDRKQKDSCIDRQIFGSDLYAHQKTFWNKKINSKWFVNELKLKLIDKLPLSFFLCVFAFLSIVFLGFITFFLAYHLVESGYAISIINFIKGICT